MRKLTVFVVLLAFSGLILGRHSEGAACLQSFDGPELTWQLTDERPGARIVSHGCVGDDAREGSGSERVTISAPGGESMHFVCPVGRIPVLDELEARLWVKANRPGVTLAARVVLPRSIDAKTGIATTTLLRGEQCAAAGRWQQLRLAGTPELLAAQARVLRATTGPNIDTREAFVDAIVLIVPGGPQNTIAWTDALEVDGVVLPAAAESTGTPRATAAVFAAPGLQSNAPSPQRPQPTAPQTEFHGTTLMVGGRPFLMRGIEWNHEPLSFLAERGFNTVWLREPATHEQSTEAARAGMWLVCPPPPPTELVKGDIDPALDRVLAWHLGSPAGPQELDDSRRWADQVRGLDPHVARPIIMTPRGDWLPTSRFADVLVADHPAGGTLYPAGGSLARDDYGQWLQSIPLLARPGTPLWAHIATQPGPRTRAQMSALSPDTPAVPTALHDRQLNSMVMSAATNACRGFLFQSASALDAGDELTQRRAMRLEMVNDQLDALSPWLTIGKRIGEATSTDGTATGVVLQAERARLLVFTARDATPQSAASNTIASANDKLAFIVPGIPESNEAFLFSPVSLQSLESKRVAGGMRVVLDRDAVGSILMTEDLAVVTALRQRCARRGRRVAQIEYSLATTRARSLASVAARLQRLGVGTKSLDQAIGAANVELRGMNALLAAGKVESAYQHAAAAERLLTAAFEKTRAEIAAGPALASVPFQADVGSLLRQAEFEKQVASFQGGANQLAGGDFESLEQLKRLGWQHIEDPIAGVQTRVQLTGRAPQEGQYCLELSAQPVPPAGPPQIVAHPLVWITSPPIRAVAGEVLEISGWIRVSQPITGSISGLEIADSLGGRELAVRIRSTSGWQPFRLIRGTSETKEVTISFALEGIGSAAIDGVMVRSLEPVSVKRLPLVESRPGPAFPTSARRGLFPPPLQR